MIPIHYFLALLAILVSISGCTQRMPPGTRQTLTSNNTTGIVDGASSDEPKQTINHGTHLDPIVIDLHPKPAPLSNLEVSQPNGARDWKLILSGADAEKLYKVMAIKPKDTDRKHDDLDALMKSGKHVACYSLNKGTYQCEFTFEGSTGELKVLNKDKKIELFKADDPRDSLYHSDFLEINSANPGGKFILSATSGTQVEAQHIFENLTDKKVQFITLKADDESGIYAEGKERKGANVDCFEQYLKSAPKDPIYSCNFWFLNSTTGEFGKY